MNLIAVVRGASPSAQNIQIPVITYHLGGHGRGKVSIKANRICLLS